MARWTDYAFTKAGARKTLRLSEGVGWYAAKADAFADTEQWKADARLITYLLPGKGRVLDLGCNTGKWLVLAQARRPEVEFFGVDVNSEALDILLEREVLDRDHVFATVQGREFYDAVICLHSIMQMENPRGVFVKVWKALKRGGTITLLTHNKRNRLLWVIPNLFNGYKDDEFIRQEHSLNELKQFMKDCGFICTKAKYHNASGLARLFPFLSQHIWYEGRKPS